MSNTISIFLIKKAVHKTFSCKGFVKAYTVKAVATLVNEILYQNPNTATE